MNTAVKSAQTKKDLNKLVVGLGRRKRS